MTSTVANDENDIAPYVGQRIALLTQHGKERVIAPVLEPALCCQIELASGYDTDLLGTFSRDIPRTSTQLAAARKKARIGMETIRRATEDLAQKLRSLCPGCGAPGFWIVERIAGLPCAECGAATRETRAEVYGCLQCKYSETHEQADRQYADPGRCDNCNP